RNLCLSQLDPAVVLPLSTEQLAETVQQVVGQIAIKERIYLNETEQKQLASDLVNDIKGLGPIQPLLLDESINDILINGPNRTFVERYGKVELINTKFRDERHLMMICQRIATDIGRRVDESSPLLDARLKDGSRVNVVFPPLALDGPYVSIRKFSKKKINFSKMVEFGSCTQAVAQILEIASNARLNIIISGGTGSGKTTLLNALSSFISFDERVVTIEDAAELQLQQPHVVRLETRPPSLEGRGEINQRDLVRNALRMRPDRIIIGETRAGEAFDMLQAMNTGHDGSMSTIHANTTRDAIGRLESMVMMAVTSLPQAAIRRQIVGAVDMIIQIGRQRDGGRRILQVSDIAGMEGEVVTINDLFRLNFEGEDENGRLKSRYQVSDAKPSFWGKLVYFNKDKEWKNIMMTQEKMQVGI
ncbi:MAG: CpaF family protein, partial [Acetobacter sp.]|nr:CpaF family protein [Acetobacter sp.]